MKRQRIAQVTLSMGQGGIENLLISLVSKQDKTKYQTYVYCLDYGGELIGSIESLGAIVRIFDRSPGLDFRLIFRLATKFREDKIEIVHTHNEAAHFYGCLAARLAGIRHVINTEHSRHYLEGHWRRKLEKRFLALLTRKIVAVSEELQQASIELDGISPARLSVVLNGVDLDRFTSVSSIEKQEIRTRLNFKAVDKIIIIVARLNPIKNHEMLIRAFARLYVEQSKLRLVIVGDGELRSELETLVGQLNISHRVCFLGDRIDVPDLLRMSDVLVLCSHREGLPLILLEGMAAQIPIVVTPGANKSLIVEHRVTGYVCDATEEALADEIQLVLNELGTETVVTAGRRLVEEKYSIEQTVNAYDTLYRQLRTKRAANV